MANRDFRASTGRDINSEARFEAYFRETYPLIYNYAYYRLLNRQSAEDVTSETFLRAAQAFDRFDSQRAKFSTWVFAIARNCLSAYLAKNTQPVVLVGDDYSICGAEGIEDDALAYEENADLCRRLLAVLDDEEREVVYLKFYREMRNTEISKALGINASTVASKLQRALIKMRGSFKVIESTEGETRQ